MAEIMGQVNDPDDKMDGDKSLGKSDTTELKSSGRKNTLQNNGTGQRCAVIPVNAPGFIFPDEHYYDTVLPKVWIGDVDLAKIRIQAFFQRIAVFFATHASEEVLDTQAREVVSRIPQKFDNKKAPSDNAPLSEIALPLRDART